VTASALRITACASALAAGLLLGGPGISVLADPGDSTDGGSDVGGSSAPDYGGTAGSNGAADPGGAASATDIDRPTSTIGNGRNDIKDRNDINDPVEPNGMIGGGDGMNAPGRASSRYQPWRIPFLRIPTPQEYAEPGWTPPSAYFTTLEIPVISLGDVLRALTKPKPKPAPSPSFRIQEEAPVIDAAPGPAGGSDYSAAADTPRAFEVPLVAAPRMPVPAAPRLGPSSGTGPPAAAGTPPTVAGANTPVIRGSLPPSGPPVTVARPLNSMTGEPTNLGYPRYLRNPTVGELSLIALPGLGGLLFLTFGGGLVGYRQANSARFIRTAGAARFLPD
jgi:hypothetical protein